MEKESLSPLEIEERHSFLFIKKEFASLYRCETFSLQYNRGGGLDGRRGHAWIQRAIPHVERPARRVGQVLQEERNQHLVQDVRLSDGLGGFVQTVVATLKCIVWQ